MDPEIAENLDINNSTLNFAKESQEILVTRIPLDSIKRVYEIHPYKMKDEKIDNNIYLRSRKRASKTPIWFRLNPIELTKLDLNKIKDNLIDDNTSSMKTKNTSMRFPQIKKEHKMEIRALLNKYRECIFKEEEKKGVINHVK